MIEPFSEMLSYVPPVENAFHPAVAHATHVVELARRDQPRRARIGALHERVRAPFLVRRRLESQAAIQEVDVDATFELRRTLGREIGVAERLQLRAGTRRAVDEHCLQLEARKRGIGWRLHA